MEDTANIETLNRQPSSDSEPNPHQSNNDNYLKRKEIMRKSVENSKLELTNNVYYFV